MAAFAAKENPMSGAVITVALFAANIAVFGLGYWLGAWRREKAWQALIARPEAQVPAPSIRGDDGTQR